MASSPIQAEPTQADPRAHLRNVLGALAVAVTDLLAEDAASRGLIPAEHAAIILIGTLPGLSQEDLQRRLGLSQPGTTRLVDRLTAQGLAARAPGPSRRMNALRLTEAGESEAEHALGSRRRLLDPLVAEMTPQDQRMAADLADRLLRGLVRSGRSPWRICRLCDQHGCEDGQPCPVEEEQQARGL